MSMSVVMTAMNDQQSIMEATESILSQTRFPDQFGLCLGPSVDQTHEFVEFYRDEFDFIVRCDEPDTYHAGRNRLRLRSLGKVKADYVLFVPADVFLYTEALEIYSRVISQSAETFNAVFGQLNYIDIHNNVTEWGLTELGAQNILKLGPINPASVLLNVSVFKDHEDRISDLRCGPFTFLTAVIECLSELEARADFTTEGMGETWCFREGDYCWDRSVFEGLLELERYLQEVVPDTASQVKCWIEHALENQDLGGLNHELDFTPGDDSEPLPDDVWWEGPVSFPE